jgi:hypothetical protein
VAPDRPVADSHPGGDGGQVEADAGPPPGVAVDLGRVGPAGPAQGQGLDRVLDEGGERVVHGGADAGDQRLVEGAAWHQGGLEGDGHDGRGHQRARLLGAPPDPGVG